MNEQDVERLLGRTTLVPAPAALQPPRVADRAPGRQRRLFAAAGLLIMAGAVACAFLFRASPPGGRPGQEAASWIEKLRSSDPHVRDDAAHRLRKLGPEALPELRKAATDADPEVAGRAKDLLAEILSKDVALLWVEAVDAVLANDGVSMAVFLRSSGFEGQEIPIEAWLCPVRGNDALPDPAPGKLEALIASSSRADGQAVKLAGDGRIQRERLDPFPRTPGDYWLILRAGPGPGETHLWNNYLVHPVRVVDERLRVLYVEHAPRYEYRFLKNALLRDPKILAHCFLTSADEGFPQEHTKSDDPLFQEPLREFPRDLKTLLQFDVVIYGDVDPALLGPGAAGRISSFVTEFGGGLLFVSGASHNPRSLAGTALAGLLPVVPDPAERPAGELLDFQYRLTADGRTSPLTNFREFRGDRDRNQEHWEDRDRKRDGLPLIRQFQKVRAVKAGASVLVEAAGVPAPAPLFVVSQAGRGRVFWSATDETWLWRYLTGDEPWFYPFWKGALLWAREAKLLLGTRRHRIMVDPGDGRRGGLVHVSAAAYDEKFEPRADPELAAFVAPPQGPPVRVTLSKDKARNGYYEGAFRSTQSGIHSVRLGEDPSTRASARFFVRGEND